MALAKPYKYASVSFHHDGVLIIKQCMVMAFPGLYSLTLSCTQELGFGM